MASGRTHDVINLLAFPPIVYYLKPVDFLGFLSGYMVGTFFLSPDNDIYHSLPNKRWKFLKFIWKPYTKIFSHRGVSHLPIIGSLTRLLYLFFVFTLFYMIIYFTCIYLFPDIKNVFPQIEVKTDLLTSPFMVSFFIGLFLSEIIHIVTDVVYSIFKRSFLRRIL